MRSIPVALAVLASCGSQVQPGARQGDPSGRPPPCRLAAGRAAPAEWQDEGGRAEATASGGSCARWFTLTTTAPLVEASPTSPRRFSERADRPVVRSGNLLFDALYALAHVEANEASVDRIRDGSFDRGEPLECPHGGCYETGKLWTYVWTRDTAYSMDLGLAAFDPPRARNSLEFKLSERRAGGNLAIVQDTGSGGSYPISTDRVAWARGAERLLHFLDGHERDRFAARALEAIGNTIEQDRLIAFDPTAGLYRGETSFLDWREQTYPAWTARDTVEIGVSHALSTNALYLFALEFAAALADQQGQGRRAARWRAWAAELRGRIATGFADGERLASYTIDGSPAGREDLLGISLAILTGAVTGDRAAGLLAGYPDLPYGPPVTWPFDREVAVYHNRAVWPFVTAYALRAARRVGDAELASAGALSLVRGAALHLSHMENFEATTGRARLEDGPRTGPVVNSPRQLWSVAGYLSMVHETVFGLETGPGGIRFRPFLPRELRRRLFAGSESLVLDRFPYRGARLTVVVRLPPAPAGTATGAYRIARVRLNGRSAPDRLWRRDELASDNLVEIELAEGRHPPPAAAPRRRRHVSAAGEPHLSLDAPPPPLLRAVEPAAGDRLRLVFEPPPRAEIAIFRDGAPIARRLPAGTRSWTDDKAKAAAAGACYALEAVDPATGFRSHRSARRCWDGRRGERRREVRLSPAGEALVKITEPGVFEWRVRYRNPGPFNTGVTCAVKRLEIVQVAAGLVLMPHTGEAPGEIRASSALTARIDRPGTYRIRIGDDARAINMSTLRHFERYTGGAGGASGPRNRAELVSLEVYARSGRFYLPVVPARASHVGAGGEP